MCLSLSLSIYIYICIVQLLLGHVNMYPWRRVPLDLESREILSTS